MKYNVYLVVGSNVEREKYFPEAIRKITSFGEVKDVSMVYETEPVGMDGADDFFNGALLLATDLEPEELKRRLRREVEEPLGRVRQAGQELIKGQKHLPRTIDVDIALWDDRVGTISGRPVPDPDILRHIHVALPLADIAPDLAHPETGQTMGDIAAGLARSGRLPRPRPDIILDY